MTTIEKQVLETWFINHRTNLMLMDALTEESLNFTISKRGGGTIGHQLAHIYNIRFFKLEKYDKALVKDLTTIRAEDNKTLKMLKDCHTVSADLIGKILESGLQQDGQMKGFKRGVVPFLGYLISHEGHHRGNILLTLKQSDFKIPDTLKYGIWEWNKI